MKLFRTIKTTIADVKAAFRLLITTTENNTRAVRELAAEQTIVRERLDALVADSAYMVTTKKRELQRLGHGH